MRAYYDEIEIEDMAWDEEKGVYHYPCPCGDRFEISRRQLADCEDISTCSSCSLIIGVIYHLLDFQSSDEESEEESEKEAGDSGANHFEGAIVPFRRIKVMDDPTTVVCESEEYFNSDDVIDVTRLNIAKPGELFTVVAPSLNAIFARESLDRSGVNFLLRTLESKWVYVIEQEDFAQKFESRDMEEKRRYEEEMAKLPGWCRSWWYQKLCSVLHVDDASPKRPEEHHHHFLDNRMKAAYAYDSQHEAATAVNHDTRRSRTFDDSRKNT